MKKATRAAQFPLPLGPMGSEPRSEADGPIGPPQDGQRWREVLSFNDTRAGLPLRTPDLVDVAVRWHNGWRIAQSWRPERGGILCTFTNGDSIWVEQPAAIMATMDSA